AVYTPVYGDLRIPGGKGRSEEGDIVGGELRVPEAGAHGDVVHVVVQVAEVLVLHGVVVADVAVIGFQVEVVEFHFHGRHLEAAFQVFHFKPAAFFGGQLKVCVDAVLHDAAVGQGEVDIPEADVAGVEDAFGGGDGILEVVYPEEAVFDH